MSNVRRDWCLAALSGLVLCACSGTPTRGPRAPTAGTAAVAGAVLDDWHDAASKADGARYFGHFTEDAVFLGSDASERWTIQEFQTQYGPFMESGRGWTCIPRDRFVTLGPRGQVAWVDELLDHSTYGVWRGTGVLRWNGETWRVAHYSMTFTIPNDVTPAVVEACKQQ